MSTEKKAFLWFKASEDEQVQFIQGVTKNGMHDGWVFHSFDNSNVFTIIPEKLQKIDIQALKNNPFDFSLTPAPTVYNYPHKIYEEKVEEAVRWLVESKADKVVLSRIKIIPAFSEPLLSLFERLIHQNPQANCYLLYLPDETCWMGATPETFLRIEDNQLQTMALAGTKTPDEKWTVKEIMEQQLVTDFILERLEGLKNLELKGPYTVSTGKLNHLRTDFNATIKPSSVEKITSSLHPTPAVCGIPQKECMAYILHVEKHDRALYTGFFGEKSQETLRFYVNLRCARIHQDAVHVFVGGGITKESNPQKEWEETERKAEVFFLL